MSDSRRTKMLKNDFEILKNVFEWLKMLKNVKKANAGPTDQQTDEVTYDSSTRLKMASDGDIAGGRSC